MDRLKCEQKQTIWIDQDNPKESFIFDQTELEFLSEPLQKKNQEEKINQPHFMSNFRFRIYLKLINEQALIN